MEKEERNRIEAIASGTKLAHQELYNDVLDCSEDWYIIEYKDKYYSWQSFGCTLYGECDPIEISKQRAMMYIKEIEGENMDEKMDWKAEQDMLDELEGAAHEQHVVEHKEDTDKRGESMNVLYEEMSKEEQVEFDMIPVPMERWMKRDMEKQQMMEEDAEFEGMEVEDYIEAFEQQQIPDMNDAIYWNSIIAEAERETKAEFVKDDTMPVTGILRVESIEEVYRSDYDSRVWPSMENPMAYHYINDCNKIVRRDWQLQTKTDEPCRGATYYLSHPRYKRDESGELVEDLKTTIFKGYILNGDYKEDIEVRAYNDNYNLHWIYINDIPVKVLSIYYYRRAKKYIADRYDRYINTIQRLQAKNENRWVQAIKNREGESAISVGVAEPIPLSEKEREYFCTDAEMIARVNRIAKNWVPRSKIDNAYAYLRKLSERLHKVEKAENLPNREQSIEFLRKEVREAEHNVACIEEMMAG